MVASADRRDSQSRRFEGDQLNSVESVESAKGILFLSVRDFLILRARFADGGSTADETPIRAIQSLFSELEFVQKAIILARGLEPLLHLVMKLARTGAISCKAELSCRSSEFRTRAWEFDWITRGSTNVTVASSSTFDSIPEQFPLHSSKGTSRNA